MPSLASRGRSQAGGRVRKGEDPEDVQFGDGSYTGSRM